MQFSGSIFIFFASIILTNCSPPFIGGIADLMMETEHENTTKLIVNQILKKTCYITEEIINEAWQKADRCDNEIRTSDLTLCRYIKERLSKCFAPVLQLFEHCSTDNNKGTPTFILNTFVSSLTYICNAKGEYLIEVFNPCLRLQDIANDCNELMTDKVKKLWSDGVKSLTKTNFCDAATTIRKCVRKDLLEQCKNGITKSAINGILDTLTVHCNA